jgi:protein SCO1/2
MSDPAKQTWIWWALLGVTLVGITGIFVRDALRSPDERALPVLGRVENFTLRNQNDQPVTRQDLLGKIWVADFIYTSCPDQCPMMSRQMEVVQGMVPKKAPVHLLSISVDPKRDTPKTLATYAEKYHYEAGRWYFLTGQPDQIQSLTRSMKLPQAEPTPQNQFNHIKTMVLVDARSRIRGYYDGTSETEVRKLVRDISHLAVSTVP